MIEIIFSYNGEKTSIQCTNEKKMKDIFKRLESKIQIDINSLFFLYNGDNVKEELTFNELANKDDKQTKK